MNITNIPFVTADWSTIERVEFKGERGAAYWRTANIAIGAGNHMQCRA